MEQEQEEVVKTMDDTMKETYAAIKARDVPRETIEETPAEKPQITVEKPKGIIPPKDPISGKFKAKAATTAPEQPITDQSTPENQATPEQVSTPVKAASLAPSGWSAAAKAKWDALDPIIRTEVLKRESDTQRGVQQYVEKAKRLDAIDAVVQPHHKQQLTGNYGSVENGIKELLALSDFAGQKPYDFLAYIINQRSLDPNQLMQILQRSPAAQQVQTQQQSFPPQALNPLEQRLSAIEQGLRKSQDDSINGVLKAFIAETDGEGALAHPHFDELRNEVAAFLDMGKNLQEAYDMAVWASPSHREQMLQQQNEQAKTAKQAEMEKQAKAAKTASTIVNVTRPNSGASPQKAKSWEETLREKHRSMVSGA